MHKSAMLRMKWFVNNYIPKDKEIKILDVGSYNVNGCYKNLFDNTKATYIGLDMTEGPNVNYVPNDPYKWDEIEDGSIDFIISGNAFEHIEFPWLTITEIHNKLKPGGITCIIAPFAHKEHRYPVDCYRYLTDGFNALAKWGGLKVIECTVGGFPKGTIDVDWYTDEFNIDNYDDTMLIAGRDLTEEQVRAMPKMGSSCKSKIWAPNIKNKKE